MPTLYFYFHFIPFRHFPYKFLIVLHSQYDYSWRYVNDEPYFRSFLLSAWIGNAIISFPSIITCLRLKSGNWGKNVRQKEKILFDKSLFCMFNNGESFWINFYLFSIYSNRIIDEKTSAQISDLIPVNLTCSRGLLCDVNVQNTKWYLLYERIIMCMAYGVCLSMGQFFIATNNRQPTQMYVRDPYLLIYCIQYECELWIVNIWIFRFSMLNVLLYELYRCCQPLMSDCRI